MLCGTEICAGTTEAAAREADDFASLGRDVPKSVCHIFKFTRTAGWEKCAVRDGRASLQFWLRRMYWEGGAVRELRACAFFGFMEALGVWCRKGETCLRFQVFEKDWEGRAVRNGIGVPAFLKSRVYGRKRISPLCANPAAVPSGTFSAMLDLPSSCHPPARRYQRNSGVLLPALRALRHAGRK